MPITQQLLLKFPTLLLGPIIVVSSAMLAVVIIFLFHFLFLPYKPRKHGKLVLVLFSAKTLIFALVISWVLFTSWTSFITTGSDVQKESDCLLELYRNTEAFLPEIKDKVHSLLRQLTDSIINDEWNTLARSELSPRTSAISKQIWNIYANYSPKNPSEQIFLQESIRKLYELRECRSRLLSDSEIGVFPLLWLVLILGEIITIASIAFFAEDLKTKLIMAVFYATFVGLIFFTILLFDFPFTGDFFIVSSKPLSRIMLY